MGFEWNILSKDSIRCTLMKKSKDILSRLGETPQIFTGSILLMSMVNDISCGAKDNEEECLANARLVSLYARRLGKGQRVFMGPGSEKKWYSISENSPQGIWDKIAERILLEFAESGCPIFRATTPLSRGRLNCKGHGNLSIHYSADLETIETLSHICFWKPAQSLRSSREDMRRVWIPSRKNGATRCDGTNKFSTRAQCDQDRSSFG